MSLRDIKRSKLTIMVTVDVIKVRKVDLIYREYLGGTEAGMRFRSLKKVGVCCEVAGCVNAS